MKTILISIASLYFVQSTGQIKCDNIQTEFSYIEFSINSMDNYPIIMSGVSKDFDIELVLKENDSLFITSFYDRCFYVPDIELTSYNVAVSCGDSISINQVKRQISKMVGEITEKSKRTVIKLANGKVVNIKICKMKGTFLIFDKIHIKDYSNSYEYLINTFDENCFLPYNVTINKLE
ncbi:MAG: hypothetical protein EOO93_28930 [Pedobacter sp.]|nr:MAG: hypothetical protein EOO93_28930 [Pedobacter sp.]